MPRPPRSLVAVVTASLLAAALAPGARADRLERKDGTAVEGAVTREGDAYRVTSRFGEVLVPTSEVAKWVRAKPFEDEWRERLAALPEGDLDARARLATWLGDAGRPAEAEATAALVLESDPEHAGAHEVLGHVRFRGRWMHPDEAKRAQGLVRRGDAWYTPAEWDLLDGASKRDAEEAEAAAVARRRAEGVNEALRLMMAQDPAVRAEGERRLRRVAEVTGAPEVADLVPKVRAYAEASDRLAKAVAAGPGGAHGRMVGEIRIQMATLKRPIGSLATSLASGPGPVSTNAPVIIQLPELEVIKLKSTIVVPVD
jgi:hypothetical protein